MRNISKTLLTLSVASLLMVGCTQETQNQIGRAINNWTGTNGVLEVYAGEKLVRRFGNGYLDSNLNGVADSDESYVYFEISDYSTQYVFYEAPKVMPPNP